MNDETLDEMLAEIKQATEDDRFPQESYDFLVTMVKNRKEIDAERGAFLTVGQEVRATRCITEKNFNGEAEWTHALEGDVGVIQSINVDDQPTVMWHRTGSGTIVGLHEIAFIPQEYKPTICIDFDGVLHSYTSGWQGVEIVADPPVPGAIEWLVAAVSSGRAQICIYSSRSKKPEGIVAMKEWLFIHVGKVSSVGLTRSEVMAQLEFPTQKPAAIMTIDDRAHRFEGRFMSLDWYLNFQPWNKRTPGAESDE